MIKTDTKRLCKAVHILRERELRKLDVENGVWNSEPNCAECQFEAVQGHSIICSKFKRGTTLGEYAKQKARRKLYERIAWRVLWLIVIIGFIIGFSQL